jgi:hypothetical protein
MAEDVVPEFKPSTTKKKKKTEKRNWSIWSTEIRWLSQFHWVFSSRAPIIWKKYLFTLEILVSICTFNQFIVLQGVSHSRPNTEDISLCYANRSAALFHLGQYEVSIWGLAVMPGASLEGEAFSPLLPQNTEIRLCCSWLNWKHIVIYPNLSFLSIHFTNHRWPRGV